MISQESQSSDLAAPDSLGDFDDALQVAHSIVRLLEGKLAQRDMHRAHALADMLHNQLAALGNYAASLAGRIRHGPVA